MAKKRQNPPASRRRFIRNGLGLAALTLVSTPRGLFSKAPDSLPVPKTPLSPSTLVPVSEKETKTLLEKGSVVVGPKERPLLIFRGPGEGFTALSALCTHEGCKVKYKPQWEEIRCPCHESLFDLSGARKEGPAKRGLDRFEVETLANRLFVRVPLAKGDIKKMEVR